MTPEQEKAVLSLLKEARKIIHCHSRDLSKDWLQRSADLLKKLEKQK